METNEPDNLSDIGSTNVFDDQDSRSAVNSLILDYYKKFGRKRDLEQYFSLSTAQSDIRDPSGLFWRRMKAQNESSESSEKPSESSTELCKISITCSVPERKDDNQKTKSDSESPPIITEEAGPISRHSDEESVKSEGNQSQKSAYITLDTSSNKPLSPTSSITSQRKLEWDSLADVGYGNESDRKTTSSSLSTIERLALIQQYSNNDNKDYAIEPPTAQSTPLDVKDDATMKNKTNKKSLVKKSREVHSKDIDVVEVTVPQTLTNMPGQSFSVNLTKHISFNVEKDGGIAVEDTEKKVKVTPEKVFAGTDVVPEKKFDKEIQTSLTKSNTSTTKSRNQKLLSRSKIKTVPTGPVLISLNTLKRRIKRRKTRTARKKSRKQNSVSEVHEKSGEQVSEAESFEYMPGHIYNQNQMKDYQQKSRNSAGNKSSLESSGITTESSKTTSFTRDLEKSIKLLSAVLRRHNDDSHLKKTMVKDVVQKLLKSKYKDDESTTDFSSKGLNRGASYRKHSTTTSTSDANNYSNEKISLPKKSILRTEKFNTSAIASTSQSVPNLSSVSTSEKPLSLFAKHLMSSNTESDVGRDFSDIPFIKTSSEELYQKYLDAAKREDRYKRHLREKEMFLKQKLVGSDNNIQIQPQTGTKLNKLKDLMNDLTRNNYNDGSGDASKLEGGSNGSHNNLEKYVGVRKQRSNSVFTLSSGNSNKKCQGSDDRENRKNNLRKRLQEEIDAGCSSKPGTSYNNYCRCPQANKCHGTDSPVQVDINKRSCKDSCSPRNNKEKDVNPKKDDQLKDIGASHIIVDRTTGQIVHYSGHDILQSMPENLMVYKCIDTKSNNAQAVTIQSNKICTQCAKIKRVSKPTSPCRVVREPKKPEDLVDILQNQNFEDDASDKCNSMKKSSQSSQTDIALAMLHQKASESLYSLTSKGFRSSKESSKCNCDSSTCDCSIKDSDKCKKGEENVILHEITRITQTDISINPKIPDPSLSDISIVSEAECCRVVSERYREVSKSKTNESESNVNRKNSETQMCPANDVFVSMTPCGSQGNAAPKTTKFGEENRDWGKIANCAKDNFNSGDNAVSLQGISANTNSYTVPIQGTNMTLKVSIGTKQQAAITEPKQIGPDGPDFCTKRVENTEESINFQQNCLKSVQYQTDNDNVNIKCPCHHGVDTQMNTSPRDVKSCVICRQITIETDIGKKRSCKVSKQTNTFNTCNAEKSSQYNTYPKSRKKPFIRTNTDTAIEVPDKVRFILENKPLRRKDFDSCCGFLPGDEPKETADKNIYKELLKTEKSTQFNPCTEKSNVSEVKIASIDKKARTDSAKSSKLNQCECEPKDFIDAFIPKSGLDLESTQCREQYCNKKDNIPAEEKSHSKTYESEGSKDLIMEAIKEITKRYSKKDTEKNERRKCFKEIMSVLNYLLDTEEATDADFKTSDFDSGKSGIEQSCGKKIIDSNEKPANHSPRKSNKMVDATDNGRTGICKCGSTKPRKKTTCTENSEDKVCGHRSTNFKEETLTTKKRAKTACAGTSFSPKRLIDKAVQLSRNKGCTKRIYATESSVSPRSSDPHDASTDTATCKILRKIKKECDKYHKSRCKCHHTDSKIESSSTTSINCDACKKVHRCRCKTASKCRCHRHHSEFSTKRSVAYNLIIQTSESMVSDEPACSKTKQQLQNIVVKVPPKCLPEPQFRQVTSMPCRQPSPPGTNRGGTTQYYRCTRSRSLPHESDISSTDDFKRAAQGLTVREYLEKNRPDFVEKASQRQNIMRMIGETRATERDLQRELLSLQLERESVLNRISASDLKQLAKELGIECRRKKPAAKFISEREMKKHSEKIYKSLPEVIRKKEEIKKENIKKSNLLMASIFKKSLQRKTLRGSVNLSNYNTVIKI